MPPRQDGYPAAPRRASAIALAFGLVLTALVAAANPDRAVGLMLVSFRFTDLWVYLVGPLAGGLAAALISQHFLARAEAPAVETRRLTAF